MQLQKHALSTRFYFSLFAVGVATFVVHEFAHWLTGVPLGYEMLASPNNVRPQGTVEHVDLTLILAAGPAITIMQGLIGFTLVRSRRLLFGFALLYMAFFMRLLAAVVSIFNANDEARVSSDLGLGLWTIPTLVVAALFMLTYLASRRLKLSFRDQFLCYVVASLVVSLVVGIDHFYFGKA